MTNKTHYRKAFDSPYMSSADVVDPITLTVEQVRLEPDHTKKTKDLFNTAYFVERELAGMKLKPMILNATNSKMMKTITGSPYIEDWQNVRVVIYVDPNVRFAKETVEGLRIKPAKASKAVLTPANQLMWAKAKEAYKRDGNLVAVLERVDISPEHQMLLIDECDSENVA